MLTKETLTKIATLLKLDEGKLTEAIKAEAETPIDIEDLTVFNAEELAARDESKLTEGKKSGEKEGENKGKELAVKDLKKAFGIEIEGKDLTKLVDAVKTQLSKGDEGLKEQVALLQKQLGDKDGEIEQTKKAAQDAIFDSQLLSSFPANRKSIEAGGFSDAEYLAAIKANLQFEHSETGVLVKKGGELVRDPKTASPLPYTDVVKTYFSERKWDIQQQQQQGGRGGGDSAPKIYSKLSELQETWQAEGKNISSAEFQQEVMAIKKKDPDFDLNA